jgi:hypothetical protein
MNQEWPESRWARTIDEKRSQCMGRFVWYHPVIVTSREYIGAVPVRISAGTTTIPTEVSRTLSVQPGDCQENLLGQATTASIPVNSSSSKTIILPHSWTEITAAVDKGSLNGLIQYNFFPFTSVSDKSYKPALPMNFRSHSPLICWSTINQLSCLTGN